MAIMACLLLKRNVRGRVVPSIHFREFSLRYLKKWTFGRSMPIFYQLPIKLPALLRGVLISVAYLTACVFIRSS